jgi:hypothetical protein
LNRAEQERYSARLPIRTNGHWLTVNPGAFFTATGLPKKLSKEAVLKVTGIGLADLSKCRIVEVCNPHNLVIAYLNQLWPVEHYYFDGHIASIVKNTKLIKWTRLKRIPAHS